MGLRIRTNVSAMEAQRSLKVASDHLRSSVQKQSSGFRINNAADDAAGLAISEKLRAEVRGINQAKRNSSDGISMVQTAEGGLTEIQDILVRLRELSIQGSSDTIGSQERGFLNDEFLALKDEIERVSKSTEFNGTRLLIGDPQSVESELVKNSNRHPLEIHIGSAYHALTDGIDADNPINIIRMDFSNIDALPKSGGGLSIGTSDDESGANLGSKLKAHEAVNRIDNAGQKIAEYRAYLGSIQNRLISTTANLSTASETMSAAKSRIKDIDYAEETAFMTQESIVQQAGSAVLLQANQKPEIALGLLQ